MMIAPSVASSDRAKAKISAVFLRRAEIMRIITGEKVFGVYAKEALPTHARRGSVEAAGEREFGDGGLVEMAAAERDQAFILAGGGRGERQRESVFRGERDGDGGVFRGV